MSHTNAQAYNIPSTQKGQPSEDAGKQGTHQYQGLIVSEVTASAYNVPSKQAAEKREGETKTASGKYQPLNVSEVSVSTYNVPKSSPSDSECKGKPATSQYQGLIMSEVSTPQYNVPKASASTQKHKTDDEGTTGSSSSSKEQAATANPPVTATDYLIPRAKKKPKTGEEGKLSKKEKHQGFIDGPGDGVHAYNVLHVHHDQSDDKSTSPATGQYQGLIESQVNAESSYTVLNAQK